jgi:hypothetical protein
MSEDTKTLNEGIQETTEQTEKQEVQYSDVEKQAMEKGWKPKEEYQGDPGKWRSAEVFVALDEPLKRIESQSKEVKALRAALEAFKEHHSKVKENEYNRALKAVKEARKQAMIDGDTEKALALEDRADELNTEKEAFVQESRQPLVQEPAELDPRFVAWTDKNRWYNNDVSMRKKADAIGNVYLAEGKSPQEVLTLVEQDIKQLFPAKFENPRANRASAVEPASRQGAGSSNAFKPTEEQRRIAQKFAKSGVMTEAEYYSDLKKMEQGA